MGMLLMGMLSVGTHRLARTLYYMVLADCWQRMLQRCMLRQMQMNGVHNDR